jgi:hypothetical protein
LAKFVLRDAVVTVAGTNLSDHFSSIEIDQPAEEVEFTGFGSGYREFGQGLKDATINGEVFTDFAAGNPIAGAVGDASTTTVTFRNAGTAGITRGTT